MSLDFELSGIKNFDQLCWMPGPIEQERRMNPITYTMIWLSMPCGFNTITAKSAELVFYRIHTMERTFGAWNRNEEGEIFITFQDVLNHIGITTNASSLTEVIFNKNVSARLVREMKDSAHHKIRKHKESLVPESGV